MTIMLPLRSALASQVVEPSNYSGKVGHSSIQYFDKVGHQRILYSDKVGHYSILYSDKEVITESCILIK